MCKCIPILSKDEIDLFSDNFFYYRDGQELIYDEKIVEQNYKTFLEKHTLLKLR